MSLVLLLNSSEVCGFVLLVFLSQFEGASFNVLCFAMHAINFRMPRIPRPAMTETCCLSMFWDKCRVKQTVHGVAKRTAAMSTLRKRILRRLFL